MLIREKPRSRHVNYTQFKKTTYFKSSWMIEGESNLIHLVVFTNQIKLIMK